MWNAGVARRTGYPVRHSGAAPSRHGARASAKAPMERDRRRAPSIRADAYRQRLPSGRVDRAIFLRRADRPRGRLRGPAVPAANVSSTRLTGGFADGSDWPQLVHIATDGESYGHHHRFGDMALAYALEQIEAQQLARADQLRRVSREDIRRPTKSRSSRKLPGAAPTASTVGGAIAAATPAPIPTGTSSGARRCAMRSTGCAITVAPLWEQQGARAISRSLVGAR